MWGARTEQQAGNKYLPSFPSFQPPGPGVGEKLEQRPPPRLPENKKAKPLAGFAIGSPRPPPYSRKSDHIRASVRRLRLLRTIYSIVGCEVRRRLAFTSLPRTGVFGPSWKTNTHGHLTRGVKARWETYLARRAGRSCCYLSTTGAAGARISLVCRGRSSQSNWGS